MDNIVKYILLQKGGNWEQDVQQKKKNKMIITDQSPFHFLADLKGKKEIKCGPSTFQTPLSPHPNWTKAFGSKLDI